MLAFSLTQFYIQRAEQLICKIYALNCFKKKKKTEFKSQAAVKGMPELEPIIQMSQKYFSSALMLIYVNRRRTAKIPKKGQKFIQRKTSDHQQSWKFRRQFAWCHLR